jgi:CPA2 family monovalent cation:H+ antiporter-2
MAHSYPLLVDFLILLAVSIPVSFVFQKMKLPSITGFLVTGMIVGPFGAGLVSDIEAVRALAEIGVVLLLFTIGLEFSFHHLFAAGPKLLFLGLAQVCLTILASILVARMFGISLNQGIVLGFLFALSSTAIVLKVLSDRSELNAPHGKIALGILIFQDLGVIPMILLIPTLGGSTIETWHILKQLGLAIATIGALILAGKYLVPLLLSQVLQFQNREIFLLTILFLCLGTAYAGASMGLSLALGAFIAGLVISESKYSHQILADILPFRDTFNAIFFISIGMLLNLPFVIADWRFNLLFAGAVLTGKALLILFVLLVARFTFRISWLAAFALAQVGEFSFLIAEQSKSLQILPENVYQLFLSSSVLTMFFTPFAILFASKTGMKLQEIAGLRDVQQAPEEPKVSDHLIIIGYGLNGKNLANVVREIGIPFVVVELNAELVNQAVQQGVPVLFGDATRTDVLRRAGVERARMVVIAISDPTATRRTVVMIRDLNPTCVILVRTRYVAEVDSLMQLGANFVIPEEFETSVEIFARVLEQYNVPEHLIEQQISIIRAESYGMLRGLSLSQERLLKLSELFLKSTVQQVVVGGGSPAANRSVRELDLRKKTGATIIAVIRENTVITNPGADYVLQQNDILVLWGDHQQLVEAERILNPLP